MLPHTLKQLVRTLALSCILLSSAHADIIAQSRGRLAGRILSADGTVAPNAAGVVVVAVNQVTGRTERERADAGGRYSMSLPAGAYRVGLEAPARANFDRGSYGELAIARGHFVENILVEPERETTLDITLEKTPEPTATPTAEAAPSPSPANGDKPLGYAGSSDLVVKPTTTLDLELPTRPARQEVRDRWRIGFPEYDRYGDRGARGRDVPFKRGRWYDPFNQNLLKGDYPIFGQKVFMILSAVSTSTVETARTPKPSNVSSARPGSAEFFGRPETLAVNQFFQFSFEMFHGDSTFRPRTWAVKISPTFSLPNYVNARETGIINIDPRRGTNRTDAHFSLEEAFAEVKLEDVNASFDFVSLRAGIQPFVSDFRGFIFSDNNLGLRLFGGFDNNRYQWNVAAFLMLEKDTNSALNRFDTRHQNVYVANLFRQDFLAKGYTVQASLHFNDDRRSRKFDRNGFQVRPALVGSAREHSVKVGYLGLSGDGHLGRLNLSHSYYYALGRDEFNPIAGRPTRIGAHMAAAELSVDKDYLRFRASAFFATGDDDPTDERANGFDAIFDDVNFVGGQFSYWNRQGIRLTQTGVALVEPNSLLPSLRSSKIQGQANFVNPGIGIVNAGLDVEVTQHLKAIFNANYLRFHRTESLEYLLFQNRIRKEIGYDLSVGVSYRPLLINNVTMTFGAALFKPGRGLRDIYTDASRNCPPNVSDFCTPDDTVINPTKLQYQLFGQLKFIF
ncbi:MAG TPA: hypothetical protein VFX96_18705 [Pyrinomonadaceae bacterium]|nr:hypothetical protein [Pyrinomonadaceae bacterium]